MLRLRVVVFTFSLFALTAGTQVFTWGVGYSGQLGRCGRFHEKCASVPTLVPDALPDQAVQVVCGGSHTAILAGIVLFAYFYIRCNVWKLVIERVCGCLYRKSK